MTLPSGNWNKKEKGGTGVAYYQDASDSDNDLLSPLEDETIWAKDFERKEDYYKAIEKASLEFESDNCLVIIENFRLESGKAGAQSNQELQTSELIGRLESFLDSHGITHVRQMNTIKSRWPKKLLKEEIEDIFGITGYEFSSRHAVDAVRHLVNGYLKMTPKEDGGFGTPFKELKQS